VLLDAIRAAKTTSMGDGGFAFSRRTSHGDLSPLYAVVLALIGLARMPSAMDEIQMFAAPAEWDHDPLAGAVYYEPPIAPLDAAARGIGGDS